MVPFRVRERAGSADEGFTLIEAVVALTLATIVFTAFATASISGVRAVLTGRTAQQATDIGERALEGMRALGYDGAAMVPGDLGVNESLPIAGCQCYNPSDDSASGATEPLALDAAGAVSPHVLTEEINNTTYTVRRYVTLPSDGAGATYKRLTVVVSWTVRDKTHTRTVSSALAQKRSGLPLPDFKWSPVGAVDACVGPGAEHVFGFTLKNNGARDSWTVAATGGSLAWSFKTDAATGDVGIHDDGDPSVADGTVGPIDPTGEELVWAVATPPATTALSTTYSVDFTVTSVSQPTYAQTISTTLQVNDPCDAVVTPTPTTTGTPDPDPTPTETPPAQPVSCTGSAPAASGNGSVTLTSYYLTNGDLNIGSTTASSPLPISKLTPPTSTTLWPYSTDLDPSPGRHLATSGTTLATTAEWQRQMPVTQAVGTGVVELWGGPASGLASDALTFRVRVDQLSSTQTLKKSLVDTTVGSGAWSCAGMKKFGVSINFGNGQGTKFETNDIISVRVSVSGSPALLGYDTTAMPARLVLPVKNGG